MVIIIALMLGQVTTSLPNVLLRMVSRDSMKTEDEVTQVGMLK
jgi:hypothetical protein